MTDIEDHIARTRREASQTPLPVVSRIDPPIEIPEVTKSKPALPPRNNGRFVKKSLVIPESDQGILL